MTLKRPPFTSWLCMMGAVLFVGLACTDDVASVQPSPPVIVSMLPADGTVDVPINTSVAVVFDSPMSPFDAELFSLSDGVVEIPGAINTSADGRTITFDPETDLAPSTKFQAVVRAGATSLRGSALADDLSWQFTTGLEVDVTRPQVSSTSPSDGMTGVATNQALLAMFSEEMNPATITDTNFMLRMDGTPIAGTVWYSGLAAMFTPNEPLDPNTEYTAEIGTGATDLAGNGILNEYEWSFTTGESPELIPPTVVATTPVDGAVDVPLNQRIRIVFSESMAPSSVNAATFTLREGSVPIAATITYSGISSVLAPWEPLAENTEYTATLSTGATDLAGNKIESSYEWRFTTGMALDTTGPIVVLTVPINNAVAVGVGQSISAVFNEPLDPATVNTTSMMLMRGAEPVSGTVSYSGVTAVFDPLTSLLPGTIYRVELAPSITDQAGNVMTNAYHWSFAVGEANETEPPTVVSTVPSYAAVGVNVDQTMSITFSEPMAPTSISASTFTLRRGATPIPSTITYSGLTAQLAPWAQLDYSTEYTLTVSTGATDLVGNALESAHEWRFTTAAEPDLVAPTVVSTSPLAGFVGAEIDVVASVTFSEPMAGTTLNSTSLSMRRGSVPVSATVTYTGVVATLSPWQVLEYETEYTVTLSTAATDVAGNGLQSAHEWRFTTRVEPDTIAPTVVLTVPAHLDSDVEIDQSIVVTFSEPLDASTVTNSSIQLFRGATPIDASVTYTGVTATLTPLDTLDYETSYMVALGANIADPSGNFLIDAGVWEFTTRIAPDITAPEIVSTSPSSGASGAATTEGVVVTFNEPMLAASVNSSSFQVSDASMVTVPGAVTLDVSGLIAMFVPTNDLLRGSTYHVTLSTGLTDIAGNALASAFAWEFHTAAGPAPVSLGAAGNFTILARTGIATTGVSDVTGDLGLSPGVDAVLMGWGQSAATTYSTSPMVDGRIYVSTYDAPTPANLELASNDMGAAYTAVAAQGPPDGVDLNAGALGGVTFAPGIYRWGAAATIATNVTIEGGPNDVWVFQVNGALAMAASVSVVLTGGARAENVFWQVNGALNIGATSHFEGIALTSTAINVGAGSSVNGRLLAQTAVAVDTCEIWISTP